MRSLIVLISLLGSVSAFAQKAPPPEEVYQCRSQGATIPDLMVQFAGARYADNLKFEIEKTELNSLLFSTDNPAKISSGILKGALQMGSCHRGTSPSLVSCDLGSGLAMLDLTFFEEQDLPNGQVQYAEVTRAIQLSAFTLEVSKATGHTALKIDAVVDNGIDHAIPLKINRIFSEADAGWGACEFGPMQWPFK